MKSIAVLFAASDSIYHDFDCCDVWDKDRNAMLYDGPYPVIAHPPCRSWGRLKHFAKPVPGEKNFARLSVNLVRTFGGILEHPLGSSLFKEQKLPTEMNCYDDYGGWSLVIDQYHFGHKARKRTRLYFCGLTPFQIPTIPFLPGVPKHTVNSSKRFGTKLPGISKKERMATPEGLADWLVKCAQIINEKKDLKCRTYLKTTIV